MRSILLLGAGRSSGSLISYLLNHADTDDFELTVADLSLDLASQKTGNHSRAKAIAFDIHNEEQRRNEILKASIVISLLPPALHIIAATDCVKHRRNLVTASYVSPAISELNAEADENGVLLLNECGLDPGIDHMSAMQLLHRLKDEGSIITSFKSYTGGLIAPESNDNPWGYKFTWNPRNVILAGQGTAKYIENGKYHYIPYNRLFLQTEKISIDGLGDYEGYANRDSLSYRKHYDIESIPTMLRGTLRQDGFCSAWNAFVKLGLTDDSCIVENNGEFTYRSLLQAFLPAGKSDASTEEQVASFLAWKKDSKEMQMLLSTGIFDETPVVLKNATAAQLLQQLLEAKWKLKENDKDLIVMYHIIEYIKETKPHRITSSLAVKGKDQVHTAMAQTVGYPLGIVARLILNGEITKTGVQIPVHPDIYNPVLKELESLGIAFSEQQVA